MQRLACLMISSAFPVIPNGALEILLNITPIEEFLLAEAVRGSYRITVSGLWHVNRVGSFGKTKSYVYVCIEARRFLCLLQIPADRIKKTKLFERNFKCQIIGKKNAIRSESQRWSRGHEARGQGQGHKINPRPRPRTAFPKTDTLEAKDRNARGQGQEPRTKDTSASALQKKKKRSSQKFFRRSQKKKKKRKRSSQKFFKRSPRKHVFQRIFQALHKILTNSKNSAVLEPRTGQFSRT